MRNIGSRSQGPSGAAAWPGNVICRTASTAGIVDTVRSLGTRVDVHDDAAPLWARTGPSLGSRDQSGPRVGPDVLATVVVMTSLASSPTAAPTLAALHDAVTAYRTCE